MIEKKLAPFLLIERKLVAFFVTWLLTVLFFTLVWTKESPMDFLYVPIIVGFYYTGPVLLLAGIPVSLLSDWISQKLPFRPLWAFIIHTGGGALVMYALPHLFGEGDGEGDIWFKIFALILGAVIAAVFWLVDEWYRRRLKKKAEWL